MRYLYSFLFYLAMPFIFLRLLWRARFAKNFPYRFAERLGFCPHQLDSCIWVHVVSLGETIAATPLIRALQTRYPDQTILLTNMTATGLARVAAVFGESVKSACIPYDLPDAVSRFLDRVKPRILVVMETELWPNLFAACKRRAIPVVITNARLSEKSAAGYRRILSLTQTMFSAISVLASQGQADAERFIALGMPQNRVSITGSLKFDLELPARLATDAPALRSTLGESRLIWVAASTHPGEDEIMLAAHEILRQQFTNALLILVPRHPERFDSVANLVQEKGFSVVRRSRGACPSDAAVYLGDSMGEMMLMYAVCDVACVAGSFAQVGGHNMIEPAALHKPIVTGPVLFNFAEISAAMLAAGGMLRVNNATELAATLIKLFSDATYRQHMGDKAFSVVEKSRGALKRQLDLIASQI